jgi:hypothetical protein
MGNRETIRAGDVQRMSAGTGVVHGEMNDGDAPVQLYQIWILPTHDDLPPTYEQKNFSRASKLDVLLPLISGQPESEAMAFGADATIFACELTQGKSVVHALGPSRGAFLYVRSGLLSVNGQRFEAGDQARISLETSIEINSIATAEFILIDVLL